MAAAPETTPSYTPEKATAGPPSSIVDSLDPPAAPTGPTLAIMASARGCAPPLVLTGHGRPAH
ncbi:hypothetical protein GCM10017607_09750 [Microbacterium thalassium]|nr:hypothetical protein GCM10017607_09750 [Microbacterium thalassium]